VLVILLIVKVTAVLLDLVNIEMAGVNLLGSQAVVLELALNLSLLLALGVLDPDALDVGTLHDMVPLVVMLAGVGLGQREEAGLVHGFGEHEGDLIPNLASLAGQGLERLLQVVQRLRPRLRSLLGGLEDGLARSDSSRGGSDQGGVCGDLHGGANRWG